MNRGESEKILRISILDDAEGVHRYLVKEVIPVREVTESTKQVKLAIEDAISV